MIGRGARGITGATEGEGARANSATGGMGELGLAKENLAERTLEGNLVALSAALGPCPTAHLGSGSRDKG